MKAILWGIIFLGIGLWIWLSNLGIRFINFSRDWPVLLILLGLWIILKRFKKRKPKIHRVLNEIEKGRISVNEAVKKIKEE